MYTSSKNRRSDSGGEIAIADQLNTSTCISNLIDEFFVTRTIVRYIRAHADSDAPKKWWQPRNMGHGTTHIHHVVIGVILVMISGLTMVTLAVDGGVPEFTAAAIRNFINSGSGSRAGSANPFETGTGR